MIRWESRNLQSYIRGKILYPITKVRLYHNFFTSNHAYIYLILLTVAANLIYEIWQMIVKNNLLYGSLKDDIYMQKREMLITKSSNILYATCKGLFMRLCKHTSYGRLGLIKLYGSRKVLMYLMCIKRSKAHM